MKVIVTLNAMPIKMKCKSCEYKIFNWCNASDVINVSSRLNWYLMVYYLAFRKALKYLEIS